MYACEYGGCNIHTWIALRETNTTRPVASETVRALKSNSQWGKREDRISFGNLASFESKGDRITSLIGQISIEFNRIFDLLPDQQLHFEQQFPKDMRSSRSPHCELLFNALTVPDATGLVVFVSLSAIHGGEILALKTPILCRTSNMMRSTSTMKFRGIVFEITIYSMLLTVTVVLMSITTKSAIFFLFFSISVSTPTLDGTKFSLFYFLLLSLLQCRMF